MTFESLGLTADLLKAVAEQGYREPTPIQQQAIPAILAGRDVLASAQTGTGKTAGFTLPLLQQLATSQPKPERSDKTLIKKQRTTPPSPKQRLPRALILTPTRELADQVNASVNLYGKYSPLRSTAIYGGVSLVPQVKALRRGVDILVATPGRLLDHLSQKHLELAQIEILVLDECDRMLDMGFIRDIRKILALLPDSYQTLLFSATFSKAIQQLAKTLLNTPALIEVAPRNTAAEQVTQIVHPVDRQRKADLLSYMIGFQNWRQVLVFTRTKRGANRLAERLTKDGLKTAAIHGNKSQGARTRALQSFKNGEVRVLVATDVASRGLDIDQLPYVVNFDLPNVPEDYVHRIGRTGRAGNEGRAVSLVSADEYPFLQDIEKLLKRAIPQEVVPDYAPTIALESGADLPKGRGSRSQPQRRKQNQPSSKTGNSAKRTRRSQSKPQGTSSNNSQPSRRKQRKRPRST